MGDRLGSFVVRHPQLICKDKIKRRLGRCYYCYRCILNQCKTFERRLESVSGPVLYEGFKVQSRLTKLKSCIGNISINKMCVESSALSFMLNFTKVFGLNLHPAAFMVLHFNYLSIIDHKR